MVPVRDNPGKCQLFDTLPNFALNVPWIFPGTALYQHALEEGKIDEMTWFKPFQPVKSAGVQPSFPIYVSNTLSTKEKLLLKARKYASELMTWEFLKRNLKFKEENSWKS